LLVIHVSVYSLLLFLLLLVLSTAIVISRQCFHYRISSRFVTRGDVCERFEIIILILQSVGTLTQGTDEFSQFQRALLQFLLAVRSQHELTGLANGSSRVPNGNVCQSMKREVSVNFATTLLYEGLP
jgi:hypothetical protein